MEHKKILYISQEIAPYLADSPMSLLGRLLPQGAMEKGFEVRTFMPKYGVINERRNQLHEVIRLSGMNVIIDDADHPLIIKVATLQPIRMQVYFIDNDDYFHFSPEKTLEIHHSPADNDERMMFFVRGVIETVKKLRWVPALIHCIGWTSALAPLYLKRMFHDDPVFSSSKIVYSLHSDKFEGNLDERFVDKLLQCQFTPEDLEVLGDGPVDYKALNRLAINYADAVIESSESVEPELVEYARQSGKPFMLYTGNDSEMSQRYVDFYSQLLS
ncbi:MAG: glycogen/starch synthase [Paramuribaculum sp.]|nr:glycogen/starch synthase [Paramuribaculum sp.]